MYQRDWLSLSPSTRIAYPTERTACSFHSPYRPILPALPYFHFSSLCAYRFRYVCSRLRSSKYGSFKYVVPSLSFPVSRPHSVASQSSGRRFSNAYWERV